MKVLVTGVNGQLGYDICRELNKNHDHEYEVRGIDKEELDLTNKSAVKKYFKKYHPDVIMHNAAWTAVDKAEIEKDKCYQVNVLGTKYLTEIAQKIGAKIVYISTDYVFNGKGENFFEIDDQINPLNYYGETKYLGEEEVRKNPKHFIVRVSWVFGINGNNFIKTMLKLAETKTELNIVGDQIGSPTYTVDLAKLLCTMINTEKYGTYHATNEGICSWAEFATEIFKIANINTKVNAVTTEEYQKLIPQQAIRPLNSRLSKKSLTAAGFNLLPTWQDALKRYLIEIKEQKVEL